MCIYIYTPGGFIAIKYIAMISYDMIYQLHIVMKLNDTFPALVKFTIIFRLDSLVLQRRNVRRNMIVPIALDVNVDWLWDQWMTPNEQHWIYGKMLGERREGSKRTRFFFQGNMKWWFQQQTGLFKSLKHFDAIKQIKWVVLLTSRFALDEFGSSKSQKQLFPRSTKPKLAFSPAKNGQGNASPKKVGTNKAVSTGEEKKKQAFLQGQIDQLHTAISSHESLPDTNLE